MSLSFRRLYALASLSGIIGLLTMTTACQKTTPAEIATDKPVSISSTAITNNTQATNTPQSTAASTIPSSTPSITNPTLANVVTIYTTFDKATLEPILQGFNEVTDIQVNIVTDSPANLLTKLETEAENTPADMLLVQDVGTFWQAKEAGLIQPFNSEKVTANIPARFQDTKGEWVGVSYYARTAVYDSRVMTANDISSYANFAKPTWLHKLCLSNGMQIPNQSLTINLLNNLGENKTTEVVKGWLVNLAIPALPSDEAVLQAIEAGKCQVGLVNSDVYGRFLEKNANTPVKLAWANKGYGGTNININGVAITKHAQHPEYALSFMEWLTHKEQQGLFASLTHSYPIGYPSAKSAEASVMLKSWGEFEPSPIPLSKYGEMRKAVLELMKTAGYH